MAAAASEHAAEEGTMSIYKAARRIKRRESTLYNALRSVADDAAFVAEIAALWPTLPLVANLRCGLWYAQPRSLAATCYFKSTDGHAGNWAFSTARLNLHLALLAGERGGCIIVDSTRKGKRFPDSMAKTIPIWCCVLNRAIQRHRLRAINQGSGLNSEMSAVVSNGDAEEYSGSSNWDSSVHLPVWVLETERNAIEGRIEEWVDLFESCGADIHSLALGLQKPLRPLWISQNTRIWLNEVPDHQLWDFTPIILVSASASGTVATQRTASEFSWRYIPGAGDDEESWARGLTPTLFWKHSYDLLDGGPDLCNQLVADIVEKDRVYRAQRGEHSPQVIVKHIKCSSHGQESYTGDHTIITQPMNSNPSTLAPANTQYSNDGHVVFWIGTSNIAVASTMQVADGLADMDCILNCDSTSRLPSNSSEDSYLELPIVDSKDERFSLLKNLPKAVSFAKNNLIARRKMLLCCQSGEDISICVALAIITRLFNDTGCFDCGESFMRRDITKLEMRKRLVFICKYAVNARPSRGNLRQVYGFLCNEKEQLPH
ncbi:tRNA A64-2'-O-ribosylphosphate transferase-like isoform X1 [Triticum urartu]|uniref:tRNA A64-2'-O-ribosylphosphate transferase n=1 Tax=Triticum urartu TaxID=4572 RepID=A0A8R7R3Q4_TRIUA|nr:tRNA A64-2'-O-ribosylphosphate transferase-like isoform X1 [Triticum urartu]XP_048544258.1 tRNA A64-2'-O-ribosylphosphate transferase-like isoform X1 [Triticum urartu]